MHQYKNFISVIQENTNMHRLHIYGNQAIKEKLMRETKYMRGFAHSYTS